MSIVKNNPEMPAKPSRDIFGELWDIRERIATDAGIDLLRGHLSDPTRYEGDYQTRFRPILTEELAALIYTHRFSLDYIRQTFPLDSRCLSDWRRIVSSRPYKTLKEWRAKRPESERGIWVHADHIYLPKLTDLSGQRYDIHYVQDTAAGPTCYRGKPLETRGPLKFVLTPEVREFFDTHAHTPQGKLMELLAPISDPVVKRWRREVAALRNPDLHAWTERLGTQQSPPPKARDVMHHAYLRDGSVLDTFGMRYFIHSSEMTPGGHMLLRGTPETHMGPGKKHQGNQIIVTPELAALFEIRLPEIRLVRFAAELGLSTAATQRIRTRLDIATADDDTHRWWLERLQDLAQLHPEAFATKHGVTPATARSMWYAICSVNDCIEGRKRGLAFIADLKSDLSADQLAEKYRIKQYGAMQKYRAALRLLEESALDPALLIAHKHRNITKRSQHDWWLERLGDLVLLTPEDFVAKHGRPGIETLKQVARNVRRIKRCDAGQDLGRGFIQDILGREPARIVGPRYGTTSETASGLRKAVQYFQYLKENHPDLIAKI